MKFELWGHNFMDIDRILTNSCFNRFVFGAHFEFQRLIWWSHLNCGDCHRILETTFRTTATKFINFKGSSRQPFEF
jgi:hypothetical protein